MRVNRLINDCIELASIRLKSSGLKITNLVEDDLKIFVDEIQIEQVVINLLNNAIDEHSASENSWIEISSSVNTNFVELIFKDCGKGIATDVLDRLFDPFYTTKEVGKGTGLGLSISRGIAQAHDGNLEYQLIDGHTAFVLSLPK